MLRSFSVLGAFTKFRKGTISFVMSVRPSARPNGTMENCHKFRIREFSKICRGSSSFLTILQEYRVLNMKTYVHL